jgi:hypothetical protein
VTGSPENCLHKDHRPDFPNKACTCAVMYN